MISWVFIGKPSTYQTAEMNSVFYEQYYKFRNYQDMGIISIL